MPPSITKSCDVMTKHIVVALMVLSAALSLAAETIQVRVYREGSNTDYDILNFEPIAGAAGECRLIKKPSSQSMPYGYNAPQMTVPEFVTDKSGKRYTVTEVGMEAFANNSNIYAVTLPESVRTIDVRAFANCPQLRMVVLSQNLEEIMPNAFNGCDDIQEVVVPVGCKLSFIGDNAFGKCNSLTSFTIPEGVTYIGSNVFEGSGLKTLQFDAKNCRIAGTRYNPPLIGLDGLTVKFGEGVRRIPDNLFAETGGLTSMDIPSGITVIGEAAFMNCADLESVTVPATVTTVGGSAFEGCASLRECNLTNVQDLGIKVFKNCTSLQSVRLYNYLMEIPDEMFMNCTSMPEFKFPSRVMLIGERAFYNCRELVIDEKSDLPDNLYQIKAEGFRGCSRLTFYPTMAGMLRDYALSATGIQEARLRSDARLSKAVFADCKSLRTVTRAALPLDEIPDSLFSGCSALDNANMSIKVAEIGAEAFRNCTALSGVKIPDDCIAIGDGAFRGCTGITAVAMNEVLQTLGIGAFSGCASLRSIVIPNSVRYLYSSVFDGCVSLTSVDIGYGVASIQEDAFRGCTAIVSVTANPVTPPAVSDRFMPQEVYASAVLKVPFGQKGAYSNATGWKNFKSAPEELGKVAVRNLLFTPNVLETGINIKVGESLPVSVTVVPQNASDQSVRWVTADESVVRVSTSDVYAKRASIRGLRPGTTKVTVDAPGAAAGTPRLYIINVNIAPRLVEQIVMGASMTMTEGTSRKLIVRVLPTNATDQSLTWASSDESIVSVSDEGELTAIKPGRAVVTVRAADGSGVEATCRVTVVERVIAVESITLDAASVTLTEGDSRSLTATVSPADATDTSVTWSSSDEAVATVDADGTITAVAPGSAFIYAIANDGTDITAECTVTVERRIIGIDKVDVSITSTGYFVGDEAALKVSYAPDNATEPQIKWSVSDSSVAEIVSVSGSGCTLRMIAAGEVTVKVTVTTPDGVSKSASVNIVVERRIFLVESVELSDVEIELTVGLSLQLTAVVAPDHADNRDIRWESSDEAVAIVSASGLVTAIGEGEAEVTASTLDGSGIKAICKVKVMAAEPVDPDNPDNPVDPDNPDNPDNPENPDNPDNPEDPSGITAPEYDYTGRIRVVDLNGRTVYGGTMGALRSARLPRGIYIVVEGQRRFKILL